MSLGNPIEPNADSPAEGENAPRPKPKPSVAPRSFRGRIVAGVLLIIPLAVTAVVVRYVYNVALSSGIAIVYWVDYALYYSFGLGAQPEKIVPANAQWHEITIAVFLTVLALYILGWLGTNVVGRRFIGLLEGLLTRIPLVDTIYGAMKRMVQSLSGSAGGDEFEDQVILIDFPHDQMRALAFLTKIVTDLNTGERHAMVFVPTSPNPTSGYMEIVPLDRITRTDWTKDEAFTMILSAGATARSEVRFFPPGAAAPRTRTVPDSADDQSRDRPPFTSQSDVKGKGVPEPADDQSRDRKGVPRNA